MISLRKIKRPNVLFILSDQHNAKVLGHKKHPDVKTPNLDKLAQEGVRFDNAITQNPICTPSRVSWLSGQYCHNHGYYGLSGQNPDGLPTVLGHFKKYGYQTAAIGKIHCPEYWVEDDCDTFYETITHTSIESNPEYESYLKEKGLWEKEDHMILREFGEKGGQSCDGRVSNLSFEDSHEGWIVNKAKTFMGNCLDNGKPFFAHVSLPKPHQCYTPSEPFWSMYDENKLTLPPNADYDLKGKAPHFQQMAKYWGKGEWALFDPKTYEAARLRKLRGYLGCVSHVDHAVGILMKWLDDNNITEDTIIVYSADHGDYACEHGIMEKAPGICADAITRIPYIWAWKGKIKKGHIAGEIAETVDMAPTLCRLAGIENMETADGKDLSNILSGGKGEVHEIGVTEFAWSKSVRKGKYRLVYYPKEMFQEEYPDGFGELYDLEADPWEMENIYFEKKNQDIVESLKNDLLNWMITTTRPKTVHGVKQGKSNQRKKRYGHSINADSKIHPDRIKDCETKNYL